MARGAAQAAQNQLGITNQLGAEQAGRARGLENQLIPGYQSLMNMGYTPEQEAGMTTAGMGAAAAPFETAQRMAQNEAARTRNAAGTAAQEDALARAKGETMGATAAGLQEEFANEEGRNLRAGLSGLQQLYGTNQQGMESMYGMAPSTINAWSQAQMSNPGLNIFGRVLGAVGKAGGGVLVGGYNGLE